MTEITRSSWTLTMRGRAALALALAATAGAWLTGDPHARLAAALLLAPLLVEVLWRGRGLPRLELRFPPRRVEAGTAFSDSLRMRNAGRRAAHALVVAHEPRLGVRGGSAVVTSLASGETVSVRLTARCRRRGRLRTRRLLVTSDWPLGLLRQEVELCCPADLVVEPARADLRPHWLEAADESEPERTAHEREGGEYFALREHRDGEDARRVHAVRSAAMGTLVRRIERARPPGDVCVVVDLRRPPGGVLGPGGRRFEWSLGAAASLIDALRRRHADARLFALGATPRVFRLAAESGDALELLAEARPRRHAPLPAEVLEDLRQAGTCLWIAAGGGRARGERRGLRRVVDVQPGDNA